MKLTVEIELNMDIEGLGEKVIEASRKAMNETVQLVHNDVIKNAITLRMVKTGTNNRSIKSEVSGLGINEIVDPNKIEGAVYSTSGYGGYLEVGTRPHTITVKKAKVLSDGENFFGKTVYHPGMNARPYFKPALDKNFNTELFTKRVRDNLK